MLLVIAAGEAIGDRKGQRKKKGNSSAPDAELSLLLGIACLFNLGAKEIALPPRTPFL